VIKMMMCDEYLSHLAAFADQRINEPVKLLLFLFIGRGRIENDDFAAADYIAVRVRRRRQRGRLDGKEKNAGAKFYSPHHSVLSFGSSCERCGQIINTLYIFGERSDDVQSGRSHNYLTALPTRISISGAYPLGGFKLARFDSRFLSFGQPGQEKPRIESARRERRRNPSASR